MTKKPQASKDAAAASATCSLRPIKRPFSTLAPSDASIQSSLSKKATVALLPAAMALKGACAADSLERRSNSAANTVLMSGVVSKYLPMVNSGNVNLS